jgi:peptidylprolyl isomerase
MTVLCACNLALFYARSARAAEPIIAKGGTVELVPEDVRTLVASLPQNAHAPAVANLNTLEQLVRAEVVQRAVLAEAKAKNFDREPATLKQMEHLQAEAITRLWLASKATAPAGYPTDADVNAAYEGARKAVPVDYHLAQIFIAAPDGGDSAKLAAAIRKAGEISTKITTADFAQLAREQSEQPESAAKGGDLGLLPENRLLPEILAAVRSLKPGETTGPIKTAQGLHFLKVLEKKPQAMPPLAEVRERIVSALRARRAQELQQTYLNELSAKLGITINQIELAKLQASLK